MIRLQGEGVGMFCKRLIKLGKPGLPLAVAAPMVAGTCVGVVVDVPPRNGVVERTATASGPGSARYANRVPAVLAGPRRGPKTINIAVFNDAANTIVPGLEASSTAGHAFAAWCNAAGGINGRKIVIETVTQRCSTQRSNRRGLPERLHGGRRRHGSRPAVRPHP